LRQGGSIYLTGDLSGQPDGFICKLDENYNFQWGKRVFAENFSYDDPKIHALPDGTLALVCNSQVDPIPLLYAHLDEEGNILDTYGYAVRLAFSTIDSDGSLVVVSPLSYDSWGTQLFQPYFFKTNTDGTLDGCPSFPACVKFEDVPIAFEALSWTATPAPPLPDMTVTVEPWEAYTEDYCGMPPPPSPAFFLPDTLCQFTCQAADSLRNELASVVQWNLLGPDTDTSFQQKDFSWCFMEPGTYTIRQRLWFLGCDYTYEREIYVLPDNLQAPIAEDELLICEESITPVLQSNRALQQVVWMDGSRDLQREIANVGEYSLLASDGYCEVSDTVLIRDFASTYPNPLSLPFTDTLLCESTLPFATLISSPYTDTIYYAGQAWSANTHVPLTRGINRVTIAIDGCEAERMVEINTHDCITNLYLPNAFSPNRDGVNDYWQPLGTNFRAISLAVFDRWGGLVWEQKAGEDFRWDGTCEGNPLKAGVYLVVFQYWNELLGTMESTNQEVMLLR